MNELKNLRTTEMKFYSQENELLHTTMVDLHVMAQNSKFIRALLRFKRCQQPSQNHTDSEKLISEHFSLEIIVDLVDIMHGRQFKRSYFLEKSLDYSIRMGYISHQLLIEPLQIMIDDCTYILSSKMGPD